MKNIKLFLLGHNLVYETGNLCFMFFPGEHIDRAMPDDDKGDNFIITRIKEQKSRYAALVYISRFGKTEKAVSFFDKSSDRFKKQSEYALGRAFYKAASKLCGFKPPWGILTGIRPVKLFREKLSDGLTDEQVKNLFENEYYVSREKTELCAETSVFENKITSLSRPESFSLYISIPFCPSRCSYCSFVSHDIEKTYKLLPEYVRLLCEELKEIAKTADTLGLRLETIYIGGGTPTTLGADELNIIFETIAKFFTLSVLREYTVEAGRPDTITKEKLDAIKRAGAERISINPQTMNDEILKSIGRKHTAGDITEAYELSKKAGIGSINMDLIAGLPGDTPEIFETTLNSVLCLKPQAITVHTLSLKRSSELVTSGSAQYNAQGEKVGKMLEIASSLLHGADYHPYYLYRQKNMSGNLENVGWSLNSHEGLYNIFIMDETHTILSAGAGGVTKVRQPNGTRIERIFNYKFPYEYISRFEKILDNKKQVIKLYEQFGKQN